MLCCVVLCWVQCVCICVIEKFPPALFDFAAHNNRNLYAKFTYELVIVWTQTTGQPIGKQHEDWCKQLTHIIYAHTGFLGALSFVYTSNYV